MTTEEKLEPFNNWPNDLGFEVIHEERTPVELVVTGNIPSYAAGTLYRTGPGGYQVDLEKGGKFSMSHWFDGFSQNHRFQIIAPDTSSSTQTRVLYNSRFSVDAFIERIRMTGEAGSISFGQKRDLCKSIFNKVSSEFVPFEALYNIGVTFSVYPSELSGGGGGGEENARDLWVNTDGAVYAQVDRQTLEPIGFADQTKLHPELKGFLSASHAQHDPITGDIINYNLDVWPIPTYRLFRVSFATGETEILATITDAPAAYIHSLIITENYVVLCIWGSRFTMDGAKIPETMNCHDALDELDPGKPNLWYVVDRRHGKGVVAKYEGDAFFCFHSINAWEEPSPSDPSQVDVVVDLIVFENLDVITRFYYANIKSTTPGSRAYIGDKGATTRGSIQRWRLPSVSSSLANRAVLEFAAPKEKSCELPTFNPQYATKPYRYIYGVTDRGNSTFYDGLVKYDIHTHSTIFWCEHGQNAGEAIFIRNPEGTEEEDDGILLSVVLDGIKGKSYLLVLDAKTLKEVGRASMECAVGFGFHGTHIA